MKVNDMAEKTLQEQHDELRAHHEGVMVSLTTLQTKLDAALQKEVDDRAAHEVALKAQADAHKLEIEQAKAAFLQALDTQTKNVAQQFEQLAAAHKAELEQQAKKHADHVAALKEKSLIPALRDLHDRKVKDLHDKHAADLEALANG
jgi:hypothetical protein